MRRRRDRRGRTPTSPLGSPFVSNTVARYGRRRAVRLAFAVLLFGVVGGAAVVVASATDTPPSGSALASPARPAVVPRATTPLIKPVNPRAIALAALNSEQQAINRVLTYTPYVAGGLPRQRMIALTFDDGPSPYTAAIVAELVRLNVPATFFVVGQQLRYFSAGLRDEIRHGFVIGDHTENHPPLSVLSPALQYFQIHTDAQQISHFGAPFPRLFRPPYALYDAQTFAILHRLKMLMVMWSVDPRDWARPGTEVIVRRVLAAARPGAIVELHDGGGNRSETLAALPGIVAGLRRRHYQFGTVPQLLAVDPPPRNQPLARLTE